MSYIFCKKYFSFPASNGEMKHFKSCCNLHFSTHSFNLFLLAYSNLQRRKQNERIENKETMEANFHLALWANL